MTASTGKVGAGFAQLMLGIPVPPIRYLRSVARLLFAAAGCGILSAEDPARTVSIGYNEYRPLIYSVPGQRPAGFAVQVLEEAARREGIELRWVLTQERAVDAVRAGTVQIWPIYPTRASESGGLHVSAPWWRTEFSLMMRADRAVADAHSWSGVLAVQDFSTSVQAARSLRNATPKLYPTFESMLAGFCRGETDGILLAYFRAQAFLSRPPAACRELRVEMALLPDVGTDLSMLSAPVAANIADGLRRRVNQMAVDGTLVRISLQYPGIMPGMAVHVAQLAATNAALKKRNELLLLTGGGAVVLGVMAAMLWFDRRRRRRAEAALQASEDRLRLALVAASMRPWDWEQERESIEDPAERNRVEAAVRDAVQRGTALEIEYRAGDRWVLAKTHAAPLADRLTGMAIDVTDRKRAELARAEVEERFRRAVLESPMPMMIYAGDGEVLNLSRSWTELSGYSVQDIPTLSAWNALALQNVGTGPQSGEQRIVTRHGDVRAWLLSRASLGKLPDGRQLALLSAVDLTERKGTEEQLRRATLELEQYAYAAAHDLQEPMRIIGLYSQLLLRKHGAEFSADAQGYFRTIVKEAGRMTGIVSGLVTYSRLVSETDPIPLLPVPLGPLVTQALAEMRTELQALSAEVRVEALPVALGESESLLNVFRHLISNAVKYVAPGTTPKIRIFATRSGDGWIISVQDNGVGIAPQYQEKIWGVFKRLHGHEVPGTGIGLAVVRKVIQQHGGRVWVESGGPGTGSTFRMTLQAPETPTGTAPEEIHATRF